MNTIIRYALLFGLFFIMQVFIFNRLELGFGAYIFILPLYLMILPFETNVFALILVGFVLGISVDALSNTFGLTASSMVLFAFLRPIIFEAFRPRDGYDPLKFPTAGDMGWVWFVVVFGILFASSLLWFFVLEVFRWGETLLILRNFFCSLIASALVISVSQFFFFNTGRKK